MSTKDSSESNAESMRLQRLLTLNRLEFALTVVKCEGAKYLAQRSELQKWGIRITQDEHEDTSSKVYAKLGLVGSDDLKRRHPKQVVKELQENFGQLVDELLAAMPGETLSERLNQWPPKIVFEPGLPPSPPSSTPEQMNRAHLLVAKESEEALREELEELERRQEIGQEKERVRQVNRERRERELQRREEQLEAERARLLEAWQRQEEIRRLQEQPIIVDESKGKYLPGEVLRRFPLWRWIAIILLAIVLTFLATWYLFPRIVEVLTPVTQVVVITATPAPPTSTPLSTNTQPTSTTFIVVVTATPEPATFTPTSTDTPLPTDTFTPKPPTNAPAPRPTSPPALPTNASSLLTQPSTSPDTLAGTILRPGEVWYQGNMEMRLRNVSFIPGCGGILGFEMSIANNTGGQLVVNISGSDFSVFDNAGRRYDNVWWNYGRSSDGCYSNGLNRLNITAMTSGERLDLAFRVLGNPDRNVLTYRMVVYQAGRIQEAAWEIEVPR